MTYCISDMHGDSRSRLACLRLDDMQEFYVS